MGLIVAAIAAIILLLVAATPGQFLNPHGVGVGWNFADQCNDGGADLADGATYTTQFQATQTGQDVNLTFNLQGQYFSGKIPVDYAACSIRSVAVDGGVSVLRTNAPFNGSAGSSWTLWVDVQVTDPTNHGLTVNVNDISLGCEGDLDCD